MLSPECVWALAIVTAPDSTYKAKYAADNWHMDCYLLWGDIFVLENCHEDAVSKFGSTQATSPESEQLA
jgi:hypothetical protein